MAEIIYRYFGDHRNPLHHNGIICVASQLDKDQRILRLGASFCNPKDIFIKKKARTIAKGRLLKNATSLTFNLQQSFEINHHNLNSLTALLIDILPRYPDSSWSRKLFRQYNTRNEE
jgi:hypothetical protein